MSISSQAELEGTQQINTIMDHTLKSMRKYAKPGIGKKKLDDYGAGILNVLGAKPAPKLRYNFPGLTLLCNRGGYVAQHEPTIVVTDGTTLILTADNCIWN